MVTVTESWKTRSVIPLQSTFSAALLHTLRTRYLFCCRNITAYLSQPHVQELIGVDPSLPSNFSSCSTSVASAFANSLDSSFPTQYYVAALLERGVQVLVYVGANDWICNWVSIRLKPFFSLSSSLYCSRLCDRSGTNA